MGGSANLEVIERIEGNPWGALLAELEFADQVLMKRPSNCSRA